MSSNVFVNLGLPVLNGAGAAVDVSTLGPHKTIVVNGDFAGCTIEIQASQVAGGASGYAPVCSFTDGDTHRVVDVACRYLRTFVRNRVSGVTFTANVDVGAPEWLNDFASITMPVADGDGADIDVSALGSFWTVNVTGTLAGARVMLMISEDGVAWSPLVSFNGVGQQSFRVSAQFAHVNVLGFSSSFTATCQIGAAADPTPAAVPGQPGDSVCLVYQPGGVETGPVVFNSWVDLDTQLQALRTAAGGGCYRIDVDDSITTPAVIPARVARWNLANTVLAGATPATLIDIADGCGFTGLRTWESGVFENLNTVTAAVADLVDGDEVFVRRATIATVTGGAVPLLSFTAIGTYRVWLLEGSALGHAGATGAAIAGSGAPAKTIRMILDSSSVMVVPTAITTGGGATVIEQIPSMTKALQVTGTLTLDATTPFALDTPASFLPTPPLTTSGAPVTATFGSWCKITTGVAQPLPAINTATARGPGAPVIVTNASAFGLAPATVTPAAGDTIMGGAGAYTIQGGTTAVFLSDGVSNWYVMVDAASALTVPQVLRSAKYAGDDGAVAVDNDVALGVFLGYASRDLPVGTNVLVSWRNVGAAVDVTWAEVALGVGGLPFAAASTPVGIVTAGATSVAVPVVSAATNFVTLVTLTVAVAKGATLYGIIAAATTTTAPTVLSGPADVQGSGVMLSCTTPGYRPSTAVGEASFAISAALGVPKQEWSAN